MGQKTALKTLVGELDRLHSGAFAWKPEDGMPDFVTSENGSQRYFSRKSREALLDLSRIMLENRSPSLPRIELDDYVTVVRQAAADMHAAGRFSELNENVQIPPISELRAIVENRIAKFADEYTHYFPAWTLGFEAVSPFTIGPVTVYNRNDWIDSVDFSSQAKSRFLSAPAANDRWKVLLKEALQSPRGSSSMEGLAGFVYGAIAECPAIIKITVRGYHNKFSRKLARLVAKTSLDAISLGFGPPECFHQQALQDERLPPFGSDSLVETEGHLWLPGSSLSKRILSLPPERVNKGLAEMAPLLPAFATMLEGLVDPSTHKHPKLANRWATALDWFAEGNREASDAIALAKIATSLDVLSCGGKNAGIRDMIIHLTGTSGQTQVVKGSQPRTLEQLIKDIYDDGRSKILHGTHYERLESFAVERQQAAFLARVALIESVVRLQNYDGTDTDKAFRLI